MQRIATRRRVALAAAVLAVLTTGLGATTQDRSGLRLTDVNCGDQITTSVKLANDVTNCGSDGIFVKGAHVVLDLNGHLISGSSGSVGVFDLATGTAATIENGRVAGFGIGIDVTAPGTKVMNMRVSGNSAAVAVLLEADSAVLTGSAVYSNAGDGVVVSGIRSQVTNNTIRKNAGRGIGAGAAGPSFLGAVISGNKVLSNDGDGIFAQSDGLTITGNTANANDGSGIVTTSDGIAVTKNTALTNTKLGIDASPGGTDGGTNHATGNGTAHQCENVVCS